MSTADIRLVRYPDPAAFLTAAGAFLL